MKSRAKYFDKYGTEISADDAFDRHGALRNGFAMRVPTTMRDAMRARDAKPQFTDGSNMADPAAGLKPGWRMPVVQDRRIVRDAYAADAAYQRNRYKCGDGEQLCDDCGGEGYDQDGNACDTCNGTGVMSDEVSTGKGGFGSRNEGGYGTPDRASHPRQTMDRLYAERDAEMANAWRQK